MLGESWQRIDPKQWEASKLLGAGSFQTWLRVTLPLLMPTISYLFTLVFLYSFLSFTIVLVLGGYLYKTFEVLIYIAYNQKLDFNQATVIATVQTLILAIFLYLQNQFSKKIRYTCNFSVGLPKLNLRRQPLPTVFFVSYLVLTAFFLISPFIAVLIRSFSGNGAFSKTFTFSNYSLLFSDGFRFAVGKDFGIVLGTSLGLAIVVALITVSTAYWFAREHGRAHDRHGERDQQRRGDDREAHAAVQPGPPGHHHQGTDGDRRRRRGPEGRIAEKDGTT
jgi:thiamine transport system permease protein